MREYSVIGKRIPRIDGVVKATGEAKYTADLVLPGMLYGKILRSPHPHARIVNINTNKAERLTGVKSVITGKDAPWKMGTYGEPFDDEYPLARDKVRYIGDEVAAVAAIDEDIAEEALELIEVEYEPLTPVFDPEEAMKPEAPKIHDHVKNNIVFKSSWNFGDVEDGFKNADYICEDTFQTEPTAHCQLETTNVLAYFDSTGKLTVWAPTMGIYYRRNQLTNALKIPQNKVRVISPYVGGGFGGKGAMVSIDVIAAILSKKTGRPVRIEHTREEQFTSTWSDFSVTIEQKIGVKRDGKILAVETNLLANNGAYAGTGPVYIYLCGVWTIATYRIPNFRYRGCTVYTNTAMRGAKRSHGTPPTRFAFESQMDMIAEKLNIDPVELRLRNTVQAGDTLPTKSKIISCGLSECIQKTAEKIGWEEKKGKPGNRGIGIGCIGFFGGGLHYILPHMASSAAFLKFNEDGTINLLTSSIDIGHDAKTTLAAIAAEELGANIEDIRVSEADTELTPPDLGNYISGMTFITGKAVQIAAADAKRQLIEIAAEKLEANVEDVETNKGRIYIKGSPERGMSFADAVMYSILQRDGNPILGKGYCTPDCDLPNINTGEGQFTPTYVFSAATAEVEVDRETGRVTVLKVCVGHDCGYPINMLGFEGQMEGSISMSHGQVVFEDLIIKEGRETNPSFMDYRIPTSLDSPEMIPFAVESIDPKGPFGGKEAGEGSVGSVIAAIANAINDALGVRIKSLPITPEKILKVLEKTKSNS